MKAFAEGLTAKPIPGKPMQAKVIPASVRGYTTAKALGEAAPGFAHTLENGYPTLTGVRPRGGKRRHATTGARAVRSFLIYKSGGVEKMFSAAGGKIFEVTSPVSPDTPPSAAVSGLTSNEFSSVMFPGIAGDVLFAVNGTDLHRTFDGSTWAANTPAITGFSTANASQCWVYANRIFMVQKNTKSVWYLPVDSIGGAAVEFTLDGIFTKGGSILFGATWSNEAGDGMGQRCVFVSTEGQAAIYQGTDPSSAASWSKVGVYEIGEPLYKNGWINVGGDLIVLTRAGMVPLSQVYTKDVAALSLSAISREIAGDWIKAVGFSGGGAWSVVKWLERGMFYVSSAPAFSVGDTADSMEGIPANWAVNSETGAWGKYTGWDVQCMVAFAGRVFFGSTDGRVYAAEETGSDDGTSYVFRYAPWPDDAETGGTYKTFKMARITYVYSVSFISQVTVGTNYDFRWPTPPSAAPDLPTASQWDSGSEWDSGAVWDPDGVRKVESKWISIGRSGFVFAPMIQLMFSNVRAPDVELTKGEYTFQTGGLVT